MFHNAVNGVQGSSYLVLFYDKSFSDICRQHQPVISSADGGPASAQSRVAAVSSRRG